MNATLSLKQDALTETYYDVEKLIWKISWDFKGVYGGDIEELFAEATLAFMRAYNKQDDSRGCFNTNLYNTVWGYLKNYRVSFSHPKKHGRVIHYVGEAYSVETAQPIPNNNFIESILEEAKRDAKEIINLFLDTPDEILEAALEKGGNIQNVTSSVKDYARDTLRWGQDRIKESFDEIKNLMNPQDDITLDEILQVIKN